MNIGQSSTAAGGGGGGVGDHHVKAEPALGQAALERVVAAAKAAHEEQQRTVEDQRQVCDLCNVRRADLRGPCGHKYHARESSVVLLLSSACGEVVTSGREGGVILVVDKPVVGHGMGFNLRPTVWYNRLGFWP